MAAMRGLHTPQAITTARMVGGDGQMPHQTLPTPAPITTSPPPARMRAAASGERSDCAPPPARSPRCCPARSAGRPLGQRSRSRMMVPARSRTCTESTTDTAGIQKPPLITAPFTNGMRATTSSGVSSSASMPQAGRRARRGHASAQFLHALLGARHLDPAAGGVHPQILVLALAVPAASAQRQHGDLAVVIGGEDEVRRVPGGAARIGQRPGTTRAAAVSISTSSSHPSSARCPTRQLPTIPAPITTTFARSGTACEPDPGCFPIPANSANYGTRVKRRTASGGRSDSIWTTCAATISHHAQVPRTEGTRSGHGPELSDAHASVHQSGEPVQPLSKCQRD